MIINKKLITALLLLCIIIILIQCGPDPQYKKKIEQLGNEYSVKNFITHAAQGNLRLVELYLKAGMQVNVRWHGYGDHTGRTALIAAASTGQTEVIKLLLKHGANTEKEAHEFRIGIYNGQTALITAATYNHLEVVKVLVEAGADINRTDYYTKETALLSAVKFDNTEIAKYLANKGADITKKLRGGQTTPYAKAQQGKTALHLAVDNKNKELVRFFVEHGGDINYVKKDGFSPMRTALYYEDDELFNLLLDLGADINCQDKEGKTILMHAVLYGGIFATDENINLVRRAVEGGADLNLQDKKWEWTALMFAANQGFENIVTYLLEHNARTDIMDVDGQSVLEIAENAGNDNIVQLISAYQ